MRLRNVIFAGSLALVSLVGLLGALGASAEYYQADTSNTVEAISPAGGEPIDLAVTWLIDQQQPDGGFGSTGETADAVLGLAAANMEPRLVKTVTGTTPIDFLMVQASEYIKEGPAEIGKLALVAVAADADPYDFGGVDLVASLWDSYSTTTGVFAADPYTSTNTWDQALAVLAIAAVQESVSPASVQVLVDWQETDGSWGFTPGSFWGGDPDSTALAMMALLAAGEIPNRDAAAALDGAVDYLRVSQLDSGGWGWTSVSPDSTGAVIQALAAMGYIPATWSWTALAGSNPQADLASIQLPSGAFPDYFSAANVMATAHALPGLAEVPFPIFGRTQMAQRAVAWLAEMQNDDGGFGDFGSDTSTTADIVLALGAAGVDAETVLSSLSASPIDFLVSQVPTYNQDGGDVGKLVMSAVASNNNPYDFGGYNLVISLTNHISPSGQLNTSNCFRQALGILGFSAADLPVPLTVTQWLKDQQMPDGGWEWAAGSGFGSDTDTTALVVQALVSAGEELTATSVISAVNYLRSMQNPDAGFGNSGFAPDTNSDSTAFTIQALVAAGEDLILDWAVDGRTPYDTLKSMQKPDGPFVYQWGNTWFGSYDNLMSTYHAIPALMEAALPINVIPAGFDYSQNHAGLVVDYGNGQLDELCVGFNSFEISGLGLLDLSGILYQVTGDGLVSKIKDVGCASSDPWCADPYYWSLWNSIGDSDWSASMAGASQAMVGDGDLQGWHWISWMVLGEPPAAEHSLQTVCGLLELAPFSPVFRGSDPDRLVTAPMWAEKGNSVDLYVPFGSDLNEDASLTVNFRSVGSRDWMTATMVRSDGVFTAALPIDSPHDLEFKATFSDSDGVQGDPVLVGGFEFEHIYLPLLSR